MENEKNMNEQEQENMNEQEQENMNEQEQENMNEQEQDFEEFYEDEMDQELPDFDAELTPAVEQEAPAAEAADAKAENTRPAAWAKASNSYAKIDKDTTALAKDLPKADEIANNLLNKAEDLVSNLQQAFPDAKFAAYVNVAPKIVEAKDAAGKPIPDVLHPGKTMKVPETDKDGAPVLMAKVALKVNPGKDNPISEVVSIQANRTGTEFTKVNNVKANDYTGGERKEVPVSELAATVAKFVETRELSINLKNFAIEANQQFKETSPKTKNKDGKDVSRTYAQYDEKYQKVTINYRENALVELNVGENNFRYATLVEFQGKGNSSIRTPIKSAKDLQAFVDAGKIAPEAADVIAAFKHNFEFVSTKTADNTKTAKTPNQQLVYDLNDKLKETTARVPGKDGKEVMNTYAQYNEKSDSVVLRNHDQPNIVVSMKKTDDGKAIVCAFNYDMKDDNDKPAMTYINTKKDVKDYLGDCPKELQNAVKEFKEMDKAKETTIDK